MQTETDSPISSAVGSRDVSMSRDASLSRGAGRGEDVDVEDRNVDAGRDREGTRMGRDGRRDLGIPRGWGKGRGEACLVGWKVCFSIRLHMFVVRLRTTNPLLTPTTNSHFVPPPPPPPPPDSRSSTSMPTTPSLASYPDVADYSPQHQHQMNEECRGVSGANRESRTNKRMGLRGLSEVVRGTNKGIAPTEANNGAVLIVTSSKLPSVAHDRLCYWKRGG